MSYIAQMLENEKQRYLKIVEENKGRKIFIFGAGRMAKPLHLFLKENGIEVSAFCVSESDMNKRGENGIPIVALSSISEEDRDSLFLLGVNPRLNKEVVSLLTEKKIRNYVESTEALRYMGQYQFDFCSNPMMEITTKMGCEINCRYCPQNVLLHNYFKTGSEEKMLTFETFKSCLDKMPPEVLIEFAGFTEPFFNPECMKMIAYAYESGHKVNLFTTLCGVTKEIFAQMKTIRFEEFVLHLPDNEKYSDIPITDEYLELLNIVVASKKVTGEDFVDYACCHGSVPEVIKGQLANRVRIFVSLLDRAGNVDAADDDRVFGKRGVAGKIRCETSCTINHNVLLPDGRVVVCAQDYAMKHVLGNLLKQSYEEVLNSQEAQHIIRCMNDKNDNSILCRNCSLAYVVEEV